MTSSFSKLMHMFLSTKTLALSRYVLTYHCVDIQISLDCLNLELFLNNGWLICKSLLEKEVL